jgi:hypothetical protein
MAGFLDDAEIEIPCSKCGHKTKKSIRWIKSNNEYFCTCGARINLNTSQFRRKIADTESALRKLRDSFNKFNK